MITTFCWKRRSSASAQSKFITQEHEYIIACAKNIKKAKWNGIPNEITQPDIMCAFTISGPKRDVCGPNQAYPLYVDETYKGKDSVGEYKDQQFSVFGGIGFNNVGNMGGAEHNKNAVYPIYAEENGDKLDAFNNCAGRNEDRPNQTYPIYAEENGDRLEGFKQHKNDGENTIRPNQTYPIHVSDGYGDYKTTTPFQFDETKARKNNTDYHHYPIHLSTHRISLTPFEGSTKILPMNGSKLGCWRAIPKTAQKLINADMLVVKKNKKGEFKIYQKQYAHWQFNKKTEQLDPIQRTTPMRSIILEPTNKKSNAEIKAIYGETAFTFAKPLDLIKNLLKIVSNPSDTVLDIFAGSGTTGQACFELGREFVLVQLDEASIPKLTQQRLDKTVGAANYQVIGHNSNKTSIDEDIQCLK